MVVEKEGFGAVKNYNIMLLFSYYCYKTSFT